MRTIYFDYNATTPLDARVREAMLPYFTEVWGNPSSIHHVGQRARAALDDARARAALTLGCKPSEIVFTSGGTESNNLAILGVARLLRNKGRHLITSAIEHHAVLHVCDYLAEQEGFQVTRLPVDAEGRVAPEDLRKALRSDTILVSIMAANNEIGTIQPVAELGRICRARGILFHTDAVQWFGKERVNSVADFQADLVAICGHKFHGPKGAGALYVRSPLQLQPMLLGGAQEFERRAGTENLPAIAGFVAALESFTRIPVFHPELLGSLTTELIHTAEQIPGVSFVGSRLYRLANTAAFAVSGADTMSLLAALDLEGVCASSGSACSAGSLSPSHVMLALGLQHYALLRFSLGRESTKAEVSTVARLLPEVIQRVQHTQ